MISVPDPDPTLEIRSLIEQLQQAVQEAGTATREAEQERDDLGSQLERALVQIDELRANERELRSHFVEISAILRERDHAVATADRNAFAAARAQDELGSMLRQRDEVAQLRDVAVRQRDEVARQRDEALQRLEALARTNSESGARSAEVQRQLATIRQARDSAHAQILELSDRASRLEDQIAELGYQRDSGKRAQQQSEDEAAESRRQLAAAKTHQEKLSRQVEELTMELDEQRHKYLDLAEQKTAVLQADHEHAVALAEARAQVASLAQERNAARLVEQAQAIELENLRTEFEFSRAREAKVAGEELASTRERLALAEASGRQARHDARDLRQQLVAWQEKVRTIEVLAEDARARREAVDAQALDAAQQSEGERAALREALQRLAEVEASRAAAEEARLGLEAQVVAMQAQSSASGGDHSSERRDLEKRFDKQRLQTIEIAAQLQAAQQQIRDLSVSLAEARLQARFAAGSSRAAAPHHSPEPAHLALVALLPPVQRGFESFSKNPAEPQLLVTLHDSVVAYAERARTTDYIALHRLTRAFASLLEGLAASPDQINDSTLHTISQTVEFLVRASAEKSPERFKDPASARIYVVDDDAGSCQCVQLVMQEQMIQTSGSQDPSAALLELASEHFDLIFLDVNMPHMNGFDLCQRLRCLSLHTETPVVFLTGAATEERREQSILSGGDDFLAKPFNLQELTVKTLTLILQRQLAR